MVSGGERAGLFFVGALTLFAALQARGRQWTAVVGWPRLRGAFGAFGALGALLGAASGARLRYKAACSRFEVSWRWESRSACSGMPRLFLWGGEKGGECPKWCWCYL